MHRAKSYPHDPASHNLGELNSFSTATRWKQARFLILTSPNGFIFFAFHIEPPAIKSAWRAAKHFARLFFGQQRISHNITPLTRFAFYRQSRPSSLDTFGMAQLNE